MPVVMAGPVLVMTWSVFIAALPDVKALPLALVLRDGH